MLPVERIEYSRFREYTHNLPFLFGIFNCNIYAGVVSSAKRRETGLFRTGCLSIGVKLAEASARHSCGHLSADRMESEEFFSNYTHIYNATFSQGCQRMWRNIEKLRSCCRINTVRVRSVDAENDAAATPGVLVRLVSPNSAKSVRARVFVHHAECNSQYVCASRVHIPCLYLKNDSLFTRVECSELSRLLQLNFSLKSCPPLSRPVHAQSCRFAQMRGTV